MIWTAYSERLTGVRVLKHICLALGALILFSEARGKEPPAQKETIPLWTLLLSVEDNDALPRGLRSSWDKIPETVDPTGLLALHMAGSAQFSALQFKSFLNYIRNYGVSPAQVIVVDLREEPHAFINGHAVRWYAIGAWWTQGNPLALVEAKEKECLSHLAVGQPVVLNHIQKNEAGYPHISGEYSSTITSLKTEQQIVTEAGAQYVRLPVTDHMKPEDQDVDQFLDLVKKLPPEACIYFHCHAGRGRTSTFMIMYDMLRNPKLPRDIIIDRQVQLGSRDLRRLSNPLKSRKHPDEKSRLEFINLFYEYLNAPDGYGTTSWTKWNMQRYDSPKASGG